jgi:hypothetical protein
MKPFALLIFIFLIQGITGQDSFKILFIQGNIEVEKNGQYVSLSVNDYIKESSIIKLKEQSQLILRDKINRFCVLQTTTFQKKYTFNDIQNLFDSQKKNGMIPSMLDYLAKELEKPSYDARDYAQNNMQKKGGVMRSECYAPIMRYPMNEQKLVISDSIIKFKWNGDSESTGYHFEIYSGDEFAGEPVYNLYSATVSDTFIEIEVTKIPEKFRIKELNWVAYSTSYRRNCARYFFKLIDFSERTKLIESIDSMLSTEESTENQWLQKAFLLESHGLLEDAYTIYLQLIEKNPSKGTYNELFELFKLRNGLIN